MKTITQADLPNLTPEEIVNNLNKGIKILDASLPFIKEIFAKLSEAFKGVGGVNSPANRLKRIQILEAQNLVQKELNKLVIAKLGLS